MSRTVERVDGHNCGYNGGMKKHLPIVVAVGIALIVIGVGYMLMGRQGKPAVEYPSKSTRGLETSGSTLLASEQSKDADGDGLADWEEALWKTDPQNPDTDGDGTKDGDEPKENRNPTVKGPDDSLLNLSLIHI